STHGSASTRGTHARPAAARPRADGPADAPARSTHGSASTRGTHARPDAASARPSAGSGGLSAELARLQIAAGMRPRLAGDVLNFA
ncbi:MAG: hypothetical protein K0U78_18030, partial [Actinomycetia bacterium]|nr:hypothetical protein [Actinomycetes bacterium]